MHKDKYTLNSYMKLCAFSKLDYIGGNKYSCGCYNSHVWM